jgi:hypothetical protein
VNQVAVDVIEAKPFERARERTLGGLLARVDPKLGGDEELVARNPGIHMTAR